MRLLLRPLDVGLAAGQRLFRDCKLISSPASLLSLRKAMATIACFWSAGKGFGTLTRRRAKINLTVLGGSLEVAEIAVD